MKTIFTSIYIVLFSFYSAISQNTFEIMFNGSYSNYADVIVTTPEGTSYMIESNIAPSTPWPKTVTYYIYRISPTGDTLRWDYQKEDTLIMYAQLLYDKVSESLFIYGIGVKLENGGGSAAGFFEWLVSVSVDFEIKWEKTYNFFPEDYFPTFYDKFLQLSDSTFLLALYATNGPGGPGKQTLGILRFNTLGDSLQYKDFPWYSSGEVRSFTFSPDSTALWIHFSRYSPENCNRNCDVLEINSLDSITTYYYPLQTSGMFYSFGAPFSAKILPDTTFVAAGMYDKGYGTIISYIGGFKFDSEFNILVENLLTEGIGPENIQTYTASDNCIDYVYPDQIYVGGAYYVPPGNFNSNDSWVYVAKFDQDMNMIWEKYLGGDAFYRTDGMCATYDGGVILTGRRYDENINSYEYDGFLYKLDGNGYIGISEKSNLKVKSAIVYPNPVSDELFLRTAIKGAVFYVYNLAGKQVLNINVQGLITTVNLNYLKPGEYLWSLRTPDKLIESGKFIKN